MPKISIGSYELSYSHNGVASDGAKPNLVLVHGAGGQEKDWPQAWRSTADLTRSMGLVPQSHGGALDQIPIYALDLPGHGASGGQSAQSVAHYADAVEKFIESMALDNVVLTGHSMGSAISLEIGIKGNPRLIALVLIGGAAKLHVSEAILTGLQSDFEATVEAITNYSWHKQTWAFFKQKGRQRMLEAGQTVVYNDYYSCSDYDRTADITKVEVPVLVIASDNDRMVREKDSRAMAESFQDGTFLLLENCGHFQHIEQTSKVADAIASFLERLR